MSGRPPLSKKSRERVDVKNFDTNFDTKLISDHITFVDNALFVSKFVLKFFYF